MVDYNLYSLAFMVIGISAFCSSYFDLDLVFGDKEAAPKSFNTQKIEGWVSLFGRRTARIILAVGGIVIMLVGIVIILLNVFGY
ncbi:hypothetical protein [Methanobrevibacter curvatus]|uniref:Uncharacterized protein n=1 Tax=Methanobrevibacter curvatus TaxID=49547 RepID=A0A166E597_9EURY|nr:hypothetical protein [Methanobrevibacter curvatus]KZX16294.1 hypothetical protein MBCUR_00980 [Methanobrevibacter curvatus]